MKLKEFKACHKWLYPNTFSEIISLIWTLKEVEKRYTKNKLYVYPIPKDLYYQFLTAVSILVEDGFYNEDFINNVSFEVKVV